ncbi:MAG: MotA/TolQ/ExbB proton channel family protein [Burkholderiaceae bacterium]
MDSQLGLIHVWAQGDWVTRIVAGTLLIMSLASWIIMLLKALDHLQLKKLHQKTESFWHSSSFSAGLICLGTEPGNPFAQLACVGQEASTHHSQTQAELQNKLDVSDWITRSLRNSIDASAARMQSGLAILASVGSTAPFIGLFGTVWGIYHALISIGAAGQATIDKVAGPVGESLIMTALGLAVAIPAVLGYNALVRSNKSTLNQLNRFAHDLHAYFVTGARVNGQALTAKKD